MARRDPMGGGAASTDRRDAELVRTRHLGLLHELGDALLVGLRQLRQRERGPTCRPRRGSPLSLKPIVAYRDLKFAASWKRQMTFPSFAYSGMPYQVRGLTPGAALMTIACTRSATTRSESGICAIFASTTSSPSVSFNASLHGGPLSCCQLSAHQ